MPGGQGKSREPCRMRPALWSSSGQDGSWLLSNSRQAADPSSGMQVLNKEALHLYIPSLRLAPHTPADLNARHVCSR